MSEHIHVWQQELEIVHLLVCIGPSDLEYTVSGGPPPLINCSYEKLLESLERLKQLYQQLQVYKHLHHVSPDTQCDLSLQLCFSHSS